MSGSTTLRQVASFENLRASAWEVFRGKRSQLDAQRLFLRLEDELFALERDLLSGDYRPGPYRSFWISDPKQRLISAAPLRDRIVHHALVRVIEPRFERRFIHHSYACRRGKGTHRCLAQFVSWARSSRFALVMDVVKMFPSVDHDVLKGELRRVLRDADVLRLVDAIIDGANAQEPVLTYFPGDDLFTPFSRKRGLPIGNLTSQFFANVLLDRVDHLVKDRLRVRRYVRYVDDLAAFGPERAPLVELRAAIAEELAAMRLELHPRKSRLRRVTEGITFLGFTVTPDEIRLGPKGLRRARRRLKQLQHGFEADRLEWADVVRSLRAWEAHLGQGTTWKLKTDVFERTVFR